jgi:N-acetylglutamate synthase-like GNAT family acetyltransferase
MASTIEIAETISAWTKQAGTMLPKDPEVVQELIGSGKGVVAFGNDGDPLAFAAITFDWPDHWKELGALVVHPEHRKKGLGGEILLALITMAKEQFPDAKFFGLCNQASLKLFLKAGGQIVTDSTLLPREVWDECKECPIFKQGLAQGVLCCDTPVLIK